MLERNRVVTFDAFCDELWDGEPPRTAVATVRTHVYHLRRVLRRADAGRGARVADRIVTRAAAYTLAVDGDEVDAHVFGALVAEGATALAAGRDEEAARILRRALGMWHGDALANVRPGRVLTPHAVALEETRNRARELRIEADLRLGRHRELIAELRGLTAAHPLNEWLRARLADALHRAGRRHEALAALGEARDLLDAELGLRPSEELRCLQRDIITGRQESS
ncbi:MAG: AfsR/SARP family transcriptional regulator [Nocardiopsaceae bacterium]|nr:AfsR/SARP family transcriptional regulator [Nocardiopsaceae bacterium]